MDKIDILIQKLDAQAAEIALLKASLGKIQNYFLWTFITTVALVVLPALGLVFAIPAFLQNFSDIQNLSF